MAGEELFDELDLKLQKVQKLELPFDMNMAMLEMGEDDADDSR